ncbi:MAG: nucleoside monophosphate kinase [Clostridia bacterium]|nr:nucleoside monophosphate kinase [Clostridia bacterium]
MNFVLIGAPLSGKGTLGNLLSEHFKIPHIGMGDLLRSAAKGDNKFSKYIQNHIESGKLINDDLVKVVLEDRLSKPDCKNGYILDGYPRNYEQALKLDTITNVDKVIYSTVSEITIMKRLASRCVCPVCYTSYNTEIYDKNYCEKCKQRLIKREDDNEETLLKRVRTFNDTSFPILDKYSKENKLVTIANEGDINDVFAELLGKI